MVYGGLHFHCFWFSWRWWYLFLENARNIILATFCKFLLKMAKMSVFEPHISTTKLLIILKLGKKCQKYYFKRLWNKKLTARDSIENKPQIPMFSPLSHNGETSRCNISASRWNYERLKGTFRCFGIWSFQLYYSKCL